MIDSKLALTVAAIKDLGSIVKAAEYLHISPSAVSHQLKKAESALGVALFTRANNRLHITEAGELVYGYAGSLQKESSVLAAEITRLKARMNRAYVHGYSNTEADRLLNQANSIADFIHHDSHWPAGSHVLEVGCGVGAQTKILATGNPECTFTSVDVSERSVNQALADPELARLPNVTFRHLDAFRVERLGTTFDHVFICFVLEHLPDPGRLLAYLTTFVKAGGTVTVVEGDHGSAYFHPDSQYARAAVAAQVQLQALNGGNANIGRELFPLLTASGLRNVKVSPRCIYVDDNNPALKENFILHTFTAMIEGMRHLIVDREITSDVTMDKGILDLQATNRAGGTFSYTFYKAIGSVRRQLVNTPAEE